MYITKSLFVEFASCPKLARWHANDKTTYNIINEANYGAMDGIAVGQATEDVVLALYADKDVAVVDTTKINFSDWYSSYHALTQEIVSDSPDVIYQ